MSGVDHAAIFGSTGTGKSTKARELVRRDKFVLALDPAGDWGREPKYQRAADIGQVATLMRRGWVKGFKIAYRPPDGRSAEALHHISVMLYRSQAAYEGAAGAHPLTLVVDEMAESYNHAHAQSAKLAGFGTLALRGRHRGIKIIGISQRPQDVSARFRDQARDWYVFALYSDMALKYIVGEWGARHREKLAGLAKYQYLYRRDGTVKLGKTGSKSRR